MMHIDTIRKGLTRTGAVLALLFVLGAMVPVSAQAKTLADGLPECPDTDYAANLRQASLSFMANASDNVDKTYKQSIDDDARNPKKYQRGKILETYCLGVYLDYFDLIAALMKGSKLVQAGIKKILDELLEYVCDAVSTPAQNVLSKLCFPMPDIAFTVDLPEIGRESCSGGLSLADHIKVDSGIPLDTLIDVPDDFLSKPMSRALGVDGDRF